MPHADHQLFLPLADYLENAELIRALQERIFVLPGRVAVVMDLVPDQFAGSSLLVPQGPHAGKFRSDAGTVITSGVADLKPEERVLVKPYDGLWMTDKDAGWIPKGREVRFYGVASPWWESIVVRL